MKFDRLVAKIVSVYPECFGRLISITVFTRDVIYFCFGISIYSLKLFGISFESEMNMYQ